MTFDIIFIALICFVFGLSCGSAKVRKLLFD